MINWKVTRMYKETLEAFTNGYRRCLHEGGASSSKTFSILQALIFIAQEAPVPTMISVVSESLPHLKRGCIRDFFNILQEDSDNNPFYSKVESRYKRPAWNAAIEFFGADDADKVRGPRRDILFINEANNVPWETAMGLDLRTNRFTIADWNPTAEFWAHEYWLPEKSSHYVHSTYLDALDVIPESVVKNIESLKERSPRDWKIYGLGELGTYEGLVYPNFEEVDELPLGAVFYGLDFGFTNDPTVLVKNVIIGDKLYSHEVFYEYGLTNDEIARKMDLFHVGKDPVYADSVEPKSIEEISRKGFNVQPAEKGQGSVEYGIQKVNQFFQYWTKDSINCIKEQKNHTFKRDRETGKYTSTPIGIWNHGMDARRYAVSTYKGILSTFALPVSNVTGRANKRKSLIRW